MTDTATPDAPLSIATATEAYERSTKRRAKALLSVKDANDELAMAGIEMQPDSKFRQ